LIFCAGFGGYAILESEKLQSSTAPIRRVLVSLILRLQPDDHFTYEFAPVQEEFVSTASGRLINLNIKFLAQAQRRCFAGEDEIRGENSEGIPREYSFRTFIPSSSVDGNEYWSDLAMKCFALSTQGGPQTFSRTLRVNRDWADHPALKPSREAFTDSAISAFIFMKKPSAFMKLFQCYEILEKISAFM
jgi:hypothetical protein